MSSERRQKYLAKNKSENTKRCRITFDLSALNLFCCYVLSDNPSIHRSDLLHTQELFDALDLSLYTNDSEKIERIKFIKKGLEGKLQGINNPELLIKYINGGIVENDIIDVNNFTAMTSAEIEWINNTVSSSLNFSFIEEEADRMIDVATRLKTSDYRTKDEIVKEMEALVDDMKNKFRRNRSDNSKEMVFTLKAGIMEDQIREVHETVTSPNRLLKTGMQGLNELIGGGFESTRVYMFLGLTGVGKSFTLLNLAYQIKKFNKHYKVKDPSKIPAIVILTMENTVDETVTRLFQIASSENKDFRGYTPDEIIHILRTEGELYLSDESPIDIIIKYKPDKSVDTSYLYTLVDDLEDDGYEVICLIQDHIKRIRSTTNSNPSDIRLELGAIVNEFKIFAQLKDLVVITNSHLNREAARTVDDAKIRNEADLVRKLGRANIGESMLMLDNIDGCYAIEKEYDSNGQLYMGFAKLKSRIKTNRDSIYQPFVRDNDIKLMMDYDLPIPVFRDSLRSQVESAQPFNNGVSRYQSNIKPIELKNDNEDDNIFSSKPVSLKSLEEILDEPTTYGEMESPTFASSTEFKPFVQKSITPGIIFDNITPGIIYDAI